ncbi:MAG TPA: hypothetical protein VFJ51_10075 [Nitrososphaeraceae archaeon]|nr:hypothetical protein [Nitrososphaeraceae archaeon]
MIVIRKQIPDPSWTRSGGFEKNGLITAHPYQQKISILAESTSIAN